MTSKKPDDATLPVPQREAPPAKVQDRYVTSPVEGRSLVSRVVSRFVARLNTGTIAANTEQVKAFNDYIAERGRTADVALETDRKIAHYLNHRDDEIENDHERYLDTLEEERTQRELNRRRRQERLRDSVADEDAARTRRDHQARIDEATQAAELAEAQWKAERAKWGLAAFQESLPYRKERLGYLASKGALDEEIEMLIAEEARNAQRGGDDRNNKSAAEPPPSRESILDRLLDEVRTEIELARGRQASEDALAVLYALQARLSAKRAEGG